MDKKPSPGIHPCRLHGLRIQGSSPLLQAFNSGGATSPIYDFKTNTLYRSPEGQALVLPNWTDSTYATTQSMMPKLA